MCAILNFSPPPRLTNRTLLPGRAVIKCIAHGSGRHARACQPSEGMPGHGTARPRKNENAPVGDRSCVVTVTSAKKTPLETNGINGVSSLLAELAPAVACFRRRLQHTVRDGPGSACHAGKRNCSWDIG